MTKKAQHSPTPWVLRSRQDELDEAYMAGISPSDWAEIRAADEITTICACYVQDLDVNYANAAHIVRCVNLHDELVEALEQLLKADDHQSRDWAKDVLAKAKETE